MFQETGWELLLLELTHNSPQAWVFEFEYLWHCLTCLSAFAALQHWFTCDDLCYLRWPLLPVSEIILKTTCMSLLLVFLYTHLWFDCCCFWVGWHFGFIRGKVDFDQRTCEISRDCFSQYVVLGGWNSHWKPWLELAAAGEMPGTPSQFQVSVYCLPSPVIRHVACWNQMWFSGGKLVNSNIDVLP